MITIILINNQTCVFCLVDVIFFTYYCYSMHSISSHEIIFLIIIKYVPTAANYYVFNFILKHISIMAVHFNKRHFRF